MEEIKIDILEAFETECDKRLEIINKLKTRLYWFIFVLTCSALLNLYLFIS